MASLLAHAENHSGGGSSVSGMEQSDQERPAVHPSSRSGEVTKCEARVVAAILSDCESADKDCQNTSEGEWDR